MTTEHTRLAKSMLNMLVVFTLLLAVSGAGCGGKNTPAEQEKPNNISTATVTGYKLYTDTDKGFTIEYPESWAMQKNFMATDIIFNSPVQNNFSANLNIIAQVNPGSSEIVVGKIKDDLVNGLKPLITNFTLKETKEVTVAGRQGLLIAYSGTQGEIKADFNQYFVSKGDRLFTITVTRPQNDPKRHDQEFMNMITSFRITK